MTLAHCNASIGIHIVLLHPVLTLGAKPIEAKSTDEPVTDASPRFRLPNEEAGPDRSLGADGGSMTSILVLSPEGSNIMVTLLKCRCHQYLLSLRMLIFMLHDGNVFGSLS